MIDFIASNSVVLFFNFTTSWLISSNHFSINYCISDNATVRTMGTFSNLWSYFFTWNAFFTSRSAKSILQLNCFFAYSVFFFYFPFILIISCTNFKDITINFTSIVLTCFMLYYPCTWLQDTNHSSLGSSFCNDYLLRNICLKVILLYSVCIILCLCLHDYCKVYQYS